MQFISDSQKYIFFVSSIPSNCYSNSIRANQHTETLQAQYAVLQQQRDELAKKLSAAEDREQKNQAALINLQCALEQFQKGMFIAINNGEMIVFFF